MSVETDILDKLIEGQERVVTTLQHQYASSRNLLKLTHEALVDAEIELDSLREKRGPQHMQTTDIHGHKQT